MARTDAPVVWKSGKVLYRSNLNRASDGSGCDRWCLAFLSNMLGVEVRKA